MTRPDSFLNPHAARHRRSLVKSHAAGEPPHIVARARDLVLRYGWNTMAYQILNPGMMLWFHPQGDAVVGYVHAQGYRVVAGAPVCEPSCLKEVASAFEAEASRAGQRVCYFGAQDRMVLVLDSGKPLSALLLGAQPVWRPHLWADRIARKASLRAQLSRARNKKVIITEWDTTRATNHPELLRCLDVWLQTRRLPPLHFLVEADTLGQLEDRHVFVAEQAGTVVGFLVASPVPRRNGWLVEQIIRTPAAPNGTTELLLDAAMRTLAAAGAGYVTLGMAPLSRRAGIVQSRQAVGTLVLLATVRVYGQRYYHFDGLDSFKAKFLPQWWEPVYAISREKHLSLRTMYAIAGAFGGMAPIEYGARSILWAMRQEAAWAQRSLQRWQQRG